MSVERRLCWWAVSGSGWKNPSAKSSSSRAVTMWWSSTRRLASKSSSRRALWLVEADLVLLGDGQQPVLRALERRRQLALREGDAVAGVHGGLGERLTAVLGGLVGDRDLAGERDEAAQAGDALAFDVAVDRLLVQGGLLAGLRSCAIAPPPKRAVRRACHSRLGPRRRAAAGSPRPSSRRCGFQRTGRTTSIPRLETRCAKSSVKRWTCSLACCSKRSTSRISAIST